MKKIGNIVRWIIGILIIVIGLALSTESAIAGILWALVGLINLPPITKKIPQFKGRTPVLVVGCIVLIFVGIASFGTTEQSSQLSQGQQNISDTPSTPSPVTTESDSLDTETAEELRQWINNSISTVNGHISASNSAIKKWSKIPEQDFLPIWESVVLDHLRSTEQFSSMVTYLKGAASLYTSLYNDNAKIAWIKQLTNDLSESDTANKELLKKYPFDLLTESPVHGTFYITQRLETSYSDNILGALQKEFDSYQAKSTSDWVAYDVEYSFGTASRGDTFRIIHADSLNPFTQSGAYEVYYVDTGTTTETVDMQGFRNTVPVYQLIENLDEAHYDLEEYQKNRNQCLTYLEELKYALDAEEYTNLQADAEKISEDVSGAYYFENGSDVYISIDASDPIFAGGFYYTVDGSYEYGGTLLTEVAPNIYCFSAYESIYVYGFSKRDQEIIADVYCNGEHIGTASTTLSSTPASETQPVSSAPDQNADYNLHFYEGSYSDRSESISIDLTVQPNETEFYCELFWNYGRLLEMGAVCPGVPTQLSEGTTITIDLRTDGGIHVVLKGSDSDPFNYEYDLTH